MKVPRSTFSKILIAAMLVATLAGCAPAKNSTSQATDAIAKIRDSLELPESSLEFVENTGMINSPSGGLSVATYRDSQGRIYSVDPQTDQVVEIDARALLASISGDAPALSQDAIKAKAILFAKSVIPTFDSLQSSLEYEEGGKVDNYFFTWYGARSPGDMNRPFLQFGFSNSGLLFAYYNTLSVGK